MTTNSLQSLLNHHHHHHTPPRHRRHSLDSPPPPTLSLSRQQSSLNLYSSSSSVKTFSLSSTSSSSTSSTSATTTTTFDLLHRLLAAQDFREADNETRRLIIALAGEAAQKRGYVFFSEVQFINETDLKTIDQLWRNYSNNKFGYSVQKRIWEKSDKDFTKFFIKVGWMKKLDTEILQYNYRAFPDEFVWELNDETPEGHLPLTNALRGTQLLGCILTHPAFVDEEEQQRGGDGEDDEQVVKEQGKERKVTVGKGLFKTNYSF